MKIFSQTPRQFGELKVTEYQLATENSGTIAVTHLPTLSDIPTKGSIVMLPGMFSNRRFWLSDKGIGIAAYFSQHGYACWMIDRRGLGAASESSSENQTLYNTIEHDLPAVQALLDQQGVARAFYMGHSFGGVLNGLSLAQGHLNHSAVAGLVNFSSQLTVGKTLLNKPFSLLLYAITGLLGHFPARRLGMGPENESKHAMRDCCRLVESAKGPSKAIFWQDFNRIQCPILAFGSEGDRVDPSAGCQAFIAPMQSTNKTFVHLGKHNGHRRDYDHVGMMISKDAQQEVWPMVKNWLDGQIAGFQRSQT